MFKKVMIVVLMVFSLNAVAGSPSQIQVCTVLSDWVGTLAAARDRGMKLQEVANLIESQKGLESSMKKKLIDSAIIIYNSNLSSQQTQVTMFTNCMKE